MRDRRRGWVGAFFLLAAGPQPASAQGLEYVRASYTKYEFQIPMRDDKKLFTAVYVPKDTAQAWPILLQRTPYSVGPYGADNYPQRPASFETFAKEGRIVLLSSHVLAETEAICDRVGIMKTGRLIEVGSVPGLLSTGVREWEIAVERLPEGLAAALRSEGHQVDAVGPRWIVRVTEGPVLQEVLGRMSRESVFVHAVEPRRQTLEEHFMRALAQDGQAAS